MHSSWRAILVALVFALIASSLMAVDTDAKRKRGSRHRANQSHIVQLVPAKQLPNNQFPELDDTLKIPGPDPCNPVEAVLNGFLPKTVTLQKTNTYWAKLTIDKGASVVSCNLSSGYLEVRFNNVTLDQYGRASAGGVSVGGWNRIAPPSTGTIRVGFNLNFAPPNTVILTFPYVLGVNIENVPNWLDDTVVLAALNAIFPNSISFQI